MATSALSKTVEMHASNQKQSFLQMPQPILHQNRLYQVSKWILVCIRQCDEDYVNPAKGEDTLRYALGSKDGILLTTYLFKVGSNNDDDNELGLREPERVRETGWEV